MLIKQQHEKNQLLEKKQWQNESLLGRIYNY